MREMKDSGIEWIGEIPNDWDVSKIKFVADFEPTCNFENVSPEDRIAYAPMECIKQGFYEARDAQYEELSHSLTPFQNGDIVMAKVTPCFENGNIAIMNELPSGIGLGSSELFVFRAKNIVAKYLFYWLQNSDFIQRACSTMTGVGGLKRVSPFFCKNCEIHIPPYNEQGRIADYLDRKCSQIDTIIARQQEVIEKLKAYKLSVITEAVTKGLNPDVPMKDSGIEWIGKTPEHWQLTKIKWVADTCSGGTPPSGDLSFYDGGINWVCSYDLHEDAIKCTQRTLSEEGAEIIAGKMQKPNSILIAMYGGSGTIGNSGILSCYARTNQAVCSVYFDEKLMNPKFALYQTIFMRKYWMYYAVGSRKDPNISQDTIRNMHYIIPPMQEQEVIVEWIESRINVVECIQRKKSNIIEKLADYKKSLIYEVVTGKKEV